MYIKVVEAEYNNALKRAYEDGYDSGRNQWQDDYGFTVPDNTVQSLEKAAYAKGLKDKEGISKSVKYEEYKKGYEHGVQHMKMQGCIDKYQEESDKVSLTEGEFESIINEAFEEGYEQAYSELHAPISERERVLQEKAWYDGYDQAICDLIEEGVLEGTDEEYSEYNFGAVEDKDEEEYCFIEELKKVLGDEYKHPENPMSAERKHSHYFKDVRHLDYVDIYQVCKLFEVEDSSHCTQHSIKKLLMSGKRGAKDKIKDITEARDTLSRYLQIEGHE